MHGGPEYPAACHRQEINVPATLMPALLPFDRNESGRLAPVAFLPPLQAV
jgi:hypothetical protein